MILHKYKIKKNKKSKRSFCFEIFGLWLGQMFRLCQKGLMAIYLGVGVSAINV